MAPATNALKPTTNIPTDNRTDAPVQPAPLKLRADPRREYIAGGENGFYGAGYFKALSPYIDDLSADWGPDIYEKMLLDSQVAAGLHVLKLSILAQGVSLIPGKKDEADPEFDRAQEVNDFCQRNLDRLDRPFLDVAYELLDALAFGHKVAEQVYEVVQEKSEDQGKLCLKALKVKPRRSTAFVVDVYYNVVALLGLLPNMGSSTVATQGLIGVGTGGIANLGEKFTPANLLPREKFVVFSFRPTNGDPRGTSVLRPAYDPWWSKQQVKQEYMKYLAQFAMPSLIGVTPEGAMAQPVMDALGNPTLDLTTGTQLYANPEENLYNALIAFQNGTALVVPFGTDIKPLEVNGDGSAFLNALAHYNQEITVAILYQTLATMEGQHQSRAASETHENVLDRVIQAAKAAFAACIQKDILKPLIKYNFGEYEANNLLPEVSLSRTEPQDFATNGATVASLWTANYLDASQLTGVDAMLGLPDRSPESITYLQEQAAYQAKAAQDLANQPNPAAPANDGATAKDKGKQPPASKPIAPNTPDAKPGNKPKGKASQ